MNILQLAKTLPVVKPMKAIFQGWLAMLILAVLAACNASDEEDGKNTDIEETPPVIIKTPNPPTNDGPLRNPLKGFHSGWFDGCCPGPDSENEVYFTNHMVSVGYQNINWGEFEPNDDEFTTVKVEERLNLNGSQNKHLILQMNMEWKDGDTTDGKNSDGSINHRTPEWFKTNTSSIERTGSSADNEDPIRAYDYEQAYYQEEVLEAISKLIELYKDDPRVHVIQMGMLGYYGEFHTFPRLDWYPERATQDMFFAHYRDQVLTDYNGYGALTQVRYPGEEYNIPTKGIGYTNGWVLDDPTNGGGEGEGIGNTDYNDPIAAGNLWENGPVGGEWPPERESFTDEWTHFWGTEAGWKYIERAHYSYLKPPKVDNIAARVPDWRLVPESWGFDATANGGAWGVGSADLGDFTSPKGDSFKLWHRKMGYNYQVSNIQHYFLLDNSKINISLDIDNVGTAPFYVKWDVELAILNASNEVVQLIPIDDVDMRDWTEGEQHSISAEANISFDTTQLYKIALRMVQPGATDSKAEEWKLFPYLSYVVLSNDIEVVEGQWDGVAGSHKLIGGWNILTTVESE